MLPYKYQQYDKDVAVRCKNQPYPSMWGKRQIKYRLTIGEFNFIICYNYYPAHRIAKEELDGGRWTITCPYTLWNVYRFKTMPKNPREILDSFNVFFDKEKQKIYRKHLGTVEGLHGQDSLIQDLFILNA